MRLLAVPAVLLVLLAVAAPAGAQPAQLTYVHDGRVWTVGADGSGRAKLPLPTTLNGKPVTYGSASWAAGGASLLVGYATGAHQDTRAGLVSPGGGAIQPLRAQGDVALSPDGTRLAYARTFPSKEAFVSKLFVENADGSGRRTLARAVYSETSYEYVGQPRWSPDGTHLAYTRAHLIGEGYSGYALHLVAPDGSSDRELTPNGEDAEFSPDGTRIAFTSRRDRNGSHATGSDEDDYDGEIYVMNADGSAQQRLTDRLGDESDPSWSADGSHLSFASDASFPGQFGSGLEVWTMATDGSCPTQLTNGSPESGGASWRPGDTGSPQTACGTLPEATVDIRVPKAAKVSPLWLGPRFGELLLNLADRSRGGGYLTYEDCAAATHAGCPTTLDVSTDWTCARDAATTALLFGSRPRRVRGALVLDVPGETNGLAVLSGRGIVDVRQNAGEATTPIPASQILAALRPVGAAPGGRLAGPALPASLVRRLARTARVRKSAGSLGAAARELHVDVQRVREQLRMVRTLRTIGPYRRLSC